MAHTPITPHKRTPQRVLAPLLVGVGVTAALVATITIQNNNPPTNVAPVEFDESTVSRMTTTTTVNPHVVLFLVDDMGSNDIGYQSQDLSEATPFLDELAATGVKLTNYYTEFECTPARSALMTGRLPISTGMQHECITPTSNWGLNKGVSTMADIFKSSDYKTHMVGKWDLGHYSEVLWPTQRGFDSFFGLTCYGYTDYSTHANKGYWDLQDVTTQSAHAPDKSAFGVYSTHLFGDRAVDIIQKHPKDKSLFLYVPFNAVHNDLTVPEEFKTTTIYESLTKDITSANRKLFAGAVYIMDQEVKRIVGQMKTASLYENAVFVMASDNGGSPIDGGNNWPMRGAKKTMFEGGQHVPAFVHSALIGQDRRGSSFPGLFHVTDWMPTLLDASSITVSDALSDKFDGFSMWPSILDGDVASSRDEVLLNIDYLSQSTETMVDSIDQVWMGLILNIDGTKYKLMINQEDYTYYLPNSNSAYGDNSNSKTANYLFDLSSDPSETKNLLQHTGTTMKDHDLVTVVHTMTARLCQLYSHKLTSTAFKVSSTEASNAKDIINNMHNGWITFWTKYDDSIQDGFAVEDAPKCNPKSLASAILDSTLNLEDDTQDIYDIDFTTVTAFANPNVDAESSSVAGEVDMVENEMTPQLRHKMAQMKKLRAKQSTL